MDENHSKRKKEKNRSSKLILKFDENNRTEYLTGFRKRRKERQEKAKQEQAKILKEARATLKRKEKEAKRKKVETLMNSFQENKERDLDDLSMLEKDKEVYEDDTTTVTVASIDMSAG